jgi:hypothetical protein
MSIRIRVYPQTQSYAAKQAATIRTKNRQIANLRTQLQQLRAQLAAVAPAAVAAPGYATTGYATPFAPATSSPFGNVFGGVAQLPAYTSGYGYGNAVSFGTPLRSGFAGGFGGTGFGW